MTDVKQPELEQAMRRLCDVALALWIIVWVVGATWLACMLGCGCSSVVVRGGLREPVKSGCRVLPCAAPEPRISPLRHHAP